MTTDGIHYDQTRDIVTIDGVHVSRQFFRALGDPRPNRLLRVIKNADGIVTVKEYQVSMPAFEDWHQSMEMNTKV